VADDPPKRKAKRAKVSPWYAEQKGLWVLCPADTEKPPKGVKDAQRKINAGDVRTVMRTSCMWNKKTDATHVAWCRTCPNGRFRVTLETITNPGAFDWLDDVIRQFNVVYEDEFRLEPGSLFGAHREIADVPKHDGRVIQVSYRMFFPDEVPNPAMRKLPSRETGLDMMDVILAAADAAGADPELVPTMNGKHRDFGDWFIMPDGHGEMRIYFVAPPR
jgi:hypothetical protein